MVILKDSYLKIDIIMVILKDTYLKIDIIMVILKDTFNSDRSMDSIKFQETIS